MLRLVRNAGPNRLERSMLFVPASNWPMIPKAAASAADAVCIDLEDSVPIAQKAAARQNVIKAFAELDFGFRMRMMRINSLDTAFSYRDLIEIVEAVGDRIDVVMLPKAEAPEDVSFVDTLLTQIESNCGFTTSIGIEAQIESAAGFVYVREIAQASPRLEALIFGPGDYAASMRMPASAIGEADANDEMYPGHRWHAVMHAIVAAARANGLRCMDGPYAGFNDAVGFERSCRIARVMGFDGKQCIHPNQLAIATSTFSPRADEVKRARDLIDAFDQATAEGRGVVSFEGKMIDAATLRMAKVVVDQAVLIERHESSRAISDLESTV